MRWDVFISHASEDKEQVALPLASILHGEGLSVWIDTQNIALGASIRESIDDGISQSACAVVILSPSFFCKQWTNNELSALLTIDRERTRILPVWHNISASDVALKYPLMADRRGISTTVGLRRVALEIVAAVNQHKTVLEYRSSVAKCNEVQERISEIDQKCMAVYRYWHLKLEAGEIYDMDYDEVTLGIGDEFEPERTQLSAQLASIKKRVDELVGLLPPSVSIAEQACNEQTPTLRMAKRESNAEDDN